MRFGCTYADSALPVIAKVHVRFVRETPAVAAIAMRPGRAVGTCERCPVFLFGPDVRATDRVPSDIAACDWQRVRTRTERNGSDGMLSCHRVARGELGDVCAQHLIIGLQFAVLRAELANEVDGCVRERVQPVLTHLC